MRGVWEWVTAALIFAALNSVGVSVSHAIEVFNAPPFTENGAQESLKKIELPNQTLVQLDPFSLILPKGWSLEAAGVSLKMSASMTATPSKDLEHDETYIGLSEKKDLPSSSLQARLEKIKKEEKDWKMDMEAINGSTWLVGRYTAVDPHSHKTMDRWAAFAIANNKEYRFLAGTPRQDKSNPYSDLIEGILKSVKLGYGDEDSVVTSAAAPTARESTTSDLIDDRLKDKWKVIGFKVADGAPGLWTEKDAQALVGISVTFKNGEIDIDGAKCQGTALPFREGEVSRSLLSDFQNPCEENSSVGPVINLKRKKCSKKTSFPPYLALGGKDNVIAFGEDISFCMKRDTGK